MTSTLRSTLSFSLLLILLFVLSPPVEAQQSVPQQAIFPDLEGEDLLAALSSAYAPDQTLGYGPARDSLYAYLQRERGFVEGVYTGFSVVLDPEADPSQDAFAKGINAEHTWPQSKGAGTEPQRSDLHILYPARVQANSARSNHPYDEIPDALTDAWYRLNESQSNVPSELIDEYSEKDNEHPDPRYEGRFEPREARAGDVARAALYFYAIYRSEAEAEDSAFFDAQKDALLAWHTQDLVDAEEYARSEYIATLQDAANPFVLDTSLVRRAFGTSGGGGAPPSDPVVATWINELHYDNEGADTGEFVEVIVRHPDMLDLADLSIVFYNGSDDGTYGSELMLTEFTTGENVGDYTVFSIDEDGIQNGSPDGLVLCYQGSPVESGGVVQFLSYEGTITATDGCAQGLTSTDIGVEEGSSTPVGQSLQLTGTGASYADFAWTGPSVDSPGALNANQTLEEDQVTEDETPPVCGEIIMDRDANPPSVTTSATDDESGIVSIAFTRLKNLDGFFDTGSGPASSYDEGDVVSFGPGEASSLEFGGTLVDPNTDRAAILVTVENGAGLTARCDPVVSRVDASAPVGFALEGNYPNPVRQFTTIPFDVAEETHVTLEVFDVLGRKVATLVDEQMAPATYRVVWEAEGLPSGTYVYRLETGNFTASEQMVLVK